MDEFELWRLPAGAGYGEEEIVGYTVSAADGRAGTVLKASAETGRSYLILMAAPLLETTMVMLPPALIESIDREGQVIHLACDLDEIRSAPAFAPDRFRDCAYRAELGFHYARQRRAAATR